MLHVRVLIKCNSDPRPRPSVRWPSPATHMQNFQWILVLLFKSLDLSCYRTVSGKEQHWPSASPFQTVYPAPSPSEQNVLWKPAILLIPFHFDRLHDPVWKLCYFDPPSLSRMYNMPMHINICTSILNVCSSFKFVTQTVSEEMASFTNARTHGHTDVYSDGGRHKTIPDRSGIIIMDSVCIRWHPFFLCILCIFETRFY